MDIQLITDRTKADVDRLRELTKIVNDTGQMLEEWKSAMIKGAYRQEDVDRVSAAIKYLLPILSDMGYNVEYRDVPGGDLTETPAGIYLGNVRNLRQVLTLPDYIPPVPDDMEGFSFWEANNIEKIILAVEETISSVKKIYPRSGVYFSGAVGYPVNGGA